MNKYDKFMEKSAKNISIALAIIFGALFILALATSCQDPIFIDPECVQCPAGQQGIQGQKGDKGDQGDTGPQGTPGIPGIDGQDGVDGKDGLQGSQGVPGPKGDKGDKGDPGESIVGPKGEKGETGPQGPDGPQGPKGDPGDGGNYVAAVVDWNFSTDDTGYNATVWNTITGDTILFQQVPGGTKVQDLADAYLDFQQFVKLSYEIEVDSEGNRVLPVVCETGGAYINVTAQNKTNTVGFTYLNENKEPMVERITVCSTTKPSNVYNAIDSVSIGERTTDRTIINVFGKVPMQAVAEYGYSPGVYTESGPKEESFDYRNHTLTIFNDQNRATYARVTSWDTGGRAYFSEELIIEPLN